MKDRIHFVGIGGIGMSAIARILNRRGYAVTGSDSKKNSIIEAMAGEGIKVHIGHDGNNLGDCREVVYSSSIKSDNPELAAARRRGIPLTHRSRMLARLAGRGRGIAVTGAHGKTTTTALLALIFEEAGMRPSAAVGGEVLNFNSNALSGSGDFFIFEADESDGSFLEFRPDAAVILNIDREHFDYFGSMENAEKAYAGFAENIKRGGRLYYNEDDMNLVRLYGGYRGEKAGFGLSQRARARASDIRQDGLDLFFKCAIDGREMGEVRYGFPGAHNVTNILAAISVAYDAGIDFDKIRDAVARYKGTKRRFEIRKTGPRLTVVEDYAHHPTEIEAVIKACEPLKKGLIVVFQPHRYTRTKDLFEEFVNCFKGAKHVILSDIYAASEKKIDEVSSQRLLSEMRRRGIVNVEHMEKDKIADGALRAAAPGDMILVLGAGDINDVAKELERKI